jgi:hypothetical protein
MKNLAMKHVIMVLFTLVYFSLFTLLRFMEKINTDTCFAWMFWGFIIGLILLILDLNNDKHIPTYAGLPTQIIILSSAILFFSSMNDCVDCNRNTYSGVCKKDTSTYWRKYIKTDLLQDACECKQASDCYVDKGEKCIRIKYRSGGKKGSFGDRPRCWDPKTYDHYTSGNFDIALIEEL